MFEKIFEKYFYILQNNLKPSIEYIYNLPQSSWSFFVTTLFKEGILKKQFFLSFDSDFIVMILPDKQLAKQIYEETLFFIPEDYVYLFLELDGIPYEWSPHDLYISGQRIRTLHAIKNHKKGIIFTTIQAVLKKLPSIELWKNNTLHLKINQQIQFNELLQILIGYGYRSVEKVEDIGEFSLKGEILDIYPVHLDRPVRIDFFDIEIESIRTFDPETQRSLDRINEIEILPTGELTLTKEQFLKLKEKLLKLNESLRKPDWLFLKSYEDYTLLNNRELSGLIEVVGFQFPLETIWKYFKKLPFCIFALEEQLEKQKNKLFKEYEILYQNYKEQKIALPPEELLDKNFDFEEFPFPSIFVHFLYDLENKNPELKYIQNHLSDTEKFKGKITDFRNYVNQLLKNDSFVIVSSAYEVQLERIASFLKNEQISYKKIEELNKDIFNLQSIYLVESPFSKGFSFPEENFYWFTDSDIFGKTISKKFQYKAKYVSPLESYLDLKEGDYVVHINHGIGRFLRLERIKAAGRERDCLVIEYADNDILYVPLDQISLIQRYLSPEENPKLDHLGKASFKKVREKVEKNIEEFAKELMELYAARLELKGYAFPPDSEFQEEFERQFPYEETPDQIKAIEDVKRDMESERPMDRLICGDVGYGKTEVAIRAVFKCVMAGKQAVVICPTTILARQHYINFKERFKNFPVKVEWISGLRTQQEIRKIKRDLKEKKIDVIIGTHALLAKDIQIPELGLLVIDEEQRFGVVHKEKLKQLKKTVDVLTLSATPIPRTLHMSLIGIRDLSIINTPPKERKPVETYVLEDSDQTLKEAILKELKRGGQIFYLHNRIKTLDIVAERIRSLVPDIRIAILHSKLHDKDIDTILNDFMEQKYDLLLTTTIIENGIDMPNVNTLIVDEADKFGLSQLYQLRGRVGRSSRQAYAYFFHKGKQVLTEEAQKRLNTLLEYQELGSGFKIAMRDLEIRGAGNILGKEQSGDIIEVGYELYLKLLENAIKKLRGEKIEQEIRCNIYFQFDFYLSENYIKDTRQRIEFYKKFESAKSLEEYEDVLQELKDRFGEPDEQSKIFILLEEIRTLGTQLGIESISENNGVIQIQPSKYFKVPIDKMMEIIQSRKSFYIKPGNTKYIFLDTLRLEYLKKNQLKYEDLKIPVTEEDLKNLISHLKELVDLVSNNKNQNKKNQKQKTIA
ncbi:MAG: transcription-repair-coupling factor [Leptospiraceae bacterium]|nr:MAG: transcription-repair-coupling factor [Leptospiraceae bacterium]